MDTTVVVAALGFVSTLLGVWLSARWQRSSAREGQILGAQVRVYGDCATALYEYERATFARALARIQGFSEEEREALRQEAYRREFTARSAIGQATFLSGNERLDGVFESVREHVEALNKTVDRAELDSRHQENLAALKAALRRVRSEMRH
ncbi:hypothetical protein [Kribbella sp. CA-247076]|uniref:hypothetical protein n=1 Tax=Kribbella sp. CA-247076 TaxID=3239941 RepID=UPI003D8EA442